MARDIHLGRSLVEQKTSFVENSGQRRLPQAVDILVQSSLKRSQIALQLRLRRYASFVVPVLAYAKGEIVVL